MRKGSGRSETRADVYADCGSLHAAGNCPAIREACIVCGISHHGVFSICPSRASVGEIRLMLDGLKDSKESHERIQVAGMRLRRELTKRASSKASNGYKATK